MSKETKSGIPGLAGLIERVRGSQPETEADETQKSPGDTSGQIFLIAGLGNPGREYVDNRHNIGFMLVDRLAARLNEKFARMQSRALVADTRYQGHRLILVKPQTFMNESGQAVAALQKFYKVPLSNVLIGFDEMDIPLGRIRMRPKGGSSGHNGMKSIIQRFGNSQSFPRLRLGIGRPPGRIPPPAFLLQDFSKEEQETILPGFLDEAADAVLAFVTEGVIEAMNRYNGSSLEND